AVQRLRPGDRRVALRSGPAARPRPARGLDPGAGPAAARVDHAVGPGAHHLRGGAAAARRRPGPGLTGAPAPAGRRPVGPDPGEAAARPDAPPRPVGRPVVLPGRNGAPAGPLRSSPR